MALSLSPLCFCHVSVVKQHKGDELQVSVQVSRDHVWFWFDRQKVVGIMTPVCATEAFLRWRGISVY